MMEIVFIRHGQTDVNKDNRLQGAHVDAELNDYGRAYAKKAAANFDENKFDVVYSSPMKRAVETAKIFTKGKKKINLDDRLLEFDFATGMARRWMILLRNIQMLLILGERSIVTILNMPKMVKATKILISDAVTF